MARKFMSNDAPASTPFIIRPKNRPPAIQQAHGKMKPGHHTKIALQPPPLRA